MLTMEMLDTIFPPDSSNGKYKGWGPVHDAVLGATWTTTQIHLSPEQCKKVFLMLPESTQGLAVSWGLSDTPFKDDVHEFVKNNMGAIEKLYSLTIVEPDNTGAQQAHSESGAG